MTSPTMCVVCLSKPAMSDLCCLACDDAFGSECGIRASTAGAIRWAAERARRFERARTAEATAGIPEPPASTLNAPGGLAPSGTAAKSAEPAHSLSDAKRRTVQRGGTLASPLDAPGGATPTETEECAACAGWGWLEETPSLDCAGCGGSGRVPRRAPGGAETEELWCVRCRNTGFDGLTKCPCTRARSPGRGTP